MTELNFFSDVCIFLQSDGLRICTFNLHRFNNSSAYLHDLCNVNDMIFIQEH